MPKIDKPKRNQGRPLTKASLLHLPAVVKTAKKKTETKRVKKNPIDYYKCLTNMAQVGFPNKITGCCKSCKQNAPTLNIARQKELQQ
jgi:hypothetical protein